MIGNIQNQAQAIKFPSRIDILRTTLVFVSVGVCLSLGFAWATFPLTAYLALVLFSAYFLYLLKATPGTTVWMLAAFGMIAFTQFISGILIESGGYLSETREMGEVTGGFLRLSILYIIFFCVATLIIETFVRDWGKNGNITLFIQNKVHPYPFLVMLFNTAIIGGLLYLFFIGTKHGFPMFTGEDRVDYARKLSDPIYTSVMGNRTGVAAYMGLMFVNSKNRLPYFCLFLLLVVVSALLGDKFTEFVVIFGLVSAPAFCKIAWEKGGLPIKNILLLGAVITTVTMPLVYVVYGGLENSSAGLEKMKDRMTLQGQLWFLSDREVKDIFRFDEPTLALDWDMITSLNPVPKIARDLANPHQGTAYMMLHYAPPRVAYDALNLNVGYCLGLQGYALLMTGWFGLLVFNFMLAASLGLIISGLLYSVVHARCIYLLYFIKFFTFWSSMVNNADLYMFINWKSALFLVSLGIYYVFDIRYIRRLSHKQESA